MLNESVSTTEPPAHFAALIKAASNGLFNMHRSGSEGGRVDCKGSKLRRQEEEGKQVNLHQYICVCEGRELAADSRGSNQLLSARQQPLQ